MEDFNTSLVREKIIFTQGETSGEVKEPVVIRSNRVFLKLGQGGDAEKVVIRAQNMHTTLRLAAKVLQSHHSDGVLLKRETPLDWTDVWENSLSGYEKEYNKDIWCSLYVNGRSVFKTFTSPFVDVIEKCALLTLDNYDTTMNVTENALKQVGHAMRINHNSNVAAVFTDNGDNMRCGIIHRSNKKDTAFNFTAVNGQQQARITQSIGATAAYLESFNLRFVIHALRTKIRAGEAKTVSPENNQIRAAISRQGAINRAILSFEENYNVKYRPAKPDFFSDI
jgi:preprotein translocase subunit SecD